MLDDDRYVNGACSLQKHTETHELAVDVATNRHWALDRLNIRLVHQDFSCLCMVASVCISFVKLNSTNKGDTHLIAQPLDVELCQLLAI